MGKVYLARHSKLEKLVAIKVLTAGKLGDQASVARFEREMKAVGRLDHPHIVRALDARQANGFNILVMEYIEGRDLSEIVKSLGPLPIADACELVRQAASGLQEAHEHGMVHRDIKPSNLMLAKAQRKHSPPVLKILDLGLALLSESHAAHGSDLTNTGQVMGTIDYMAPEQGGDSHQVDIRADIYSLGATLFKLLTGSAPYEGAKYDTPIKKLAALATTPPPDIRARRADMPLELAKLVHRMLAKNPNERIATPEQVVAVLSPFCAGCNLEVLLRKAIGESITKGALAQSSSDSLSANMAKTTAFAPKENIENIAPGGDALTPFLSTVALPQPHGEHQAWTQSPPLPRPIRGSHGRWNRVPLVVRIGAIAGGGVMAILMGIVLFLPGKKGTVRIEVNDPAIEILVHESGTTIKGVGKKEITLTAGEQGFTIKRDDLQFETDRFLLSQGGVVTLRIDLLADKLMASLNGDPLGSVHVPKQPERNAVGDEDAEGWHGWPKNAPRPAIAPFNDEDSLIHRDTWAKHLHVPPQFVNSIGMEFVLIPPGDFMMGFTTNEIVELLSTDPERDNPYAQERIKSQGPRHKVILTQPFYLGIHEVTQAQYELIMGQNPSRTITHYLVDKNILENMDTSRHPVDTVLWGEAVEFCRKLSQRENLIPFEFGMRDGEVMANAGDGYRLPTEAEWEFCCRAGTTTKHWAGDSEDDLQRVAWTNVNSGRTTHPVGEKKPNPFGLFDMHGNVGEWVQDGWKPDYYANFEQQPAINPNCPDERGNRVSRGGYAGTGSRHLWSATRLPVLPSNREKNNQVGFRVVLTVEAVKAGSSTK